MDQLEIPILVYEYMIFSYQDLVLRNFKQFYSVSIAVVNIK